MRTTLWFAVIGVAAPLAGYAQSGANPVVSTAREIFDRQSKYIVAAAEEMPADKYSYHPTPEQWSFGKVAAHIATSGTAICGMLNDAPTSAAALKVSETDGKDAIVAAVKASFSLCDQALHTVTDAQMGDTITYFRGARTPRARALFELTDDLEDHYSQLAGYLRLNGLTPPSAAPRK